MTPDDSEQPEPGIEDQPADAAADDSSGEINDDDSAPAPPEWVTLGGDESLTPSQAGELAAEYGATVVLVAGEFESGKTTLLVELYSKFLVGNFAGCAFAGSRTLIQFDRIHLPTRESSGEQRPTTHRTQEEDMRMLHLALRANGRRVVLLPSDVRGEFFEHIIDGAPVAGEVPLARRSDRTLVLIDGKRIANTIDRQEAISRARLLIGGLTESGGLQRGRPLGIVLAKADLVDGPGRAWFAEQAAALSDFARERGMLPEVLELAARPDVSPDEPENLDVLLKWMVSGQEPGAKSGVPPLASDRFFWRFSELP